jgi:hypothetical protein
MFVEGITVSYNLSIKANNVFIFELQVLVSNIPILLQFKYNEITSLTIFEEQ